MRQLSDLLDEARADPPPARYALDDVVAAGRRWQRRRNTGWAIVAAAAVAAAIGVPQIVTRADPAPRPVVTEPAPPPAPSGKPAVEYTFAAYTAGRFRVDNPIGWGLAGESAAIWPAATADQVGLLLVDRPGVDPLARLPHPTKTDTAPVHGRHAFFVQSTPSDARWLAWEYTTGALAVIKPRRAGAMSDAELRQLAEAFPAVTRTAVRFPAKVGYVTGDYTFVDVTADPKSGWAMAVFVPAGQVALRLRQPDRGLPTGGKGQAGNVVSIEVTPQATAGAAKVTCVDAIRPAGSTEPMGGSCGRPLPGGKYTLMVEAGPTVSQREIRKMLEALDPADPADPATWLPVSTAIPASSLPSGY